MKTKETLKVALCQIAPIWINRTLTLKKVMEYVHQAAKEKAELVVFGEALLPGYPFWLDCMNGSKFDSQIQKEIHSHYIHQSVCIEKGHVNDLCVLAKQENIAIYLGIIENPIDRGQSLYCSMLFIDQNGCIKSAHRKLMPTYEERLCWAIGDGHGLKTHLLPPFTVGGLNCWENWMPLARTTLYAQGEDLHVSIWPGSKRNTSQLIPVIAQEARAYVLGVSGLFRYSDIPDNFPYAEQMRSKTKTTLADGGSCLASPTGEWVVEPFTDEEKMIVTEIDHRKVREERQNFDPVGHYSRPDVLQLKVNHDRQSTFFTDTEK